MATNAPLSPRRLQCSCTVTNVMTCARRPPNSWMVWMTASKRTRVAAAVSLLLASCNQPYAVTNDLCSEGLAGRAAKVAIGGQLRVLDVCPTAQHVCVLTEYLSISDFATDPSDLPLKGVDRGCPEVQTLAGPGNKLVVLHAQSCPSIAHLGIVRASTSFDVTSCVSAERSHIVRAKAVFVVSDAVAQ